MTRQVRGAGILRSGRRLPDSEHNKRWTFTLFPGEPLTAGLAESGTVLKGKVRFRLGKPDRGIGSARIAAAITVWPKAIRLRADRLPEPGLDIAGGRAHC